VWEADETMVKSWVAEVGPVVTTIYASGEFGRYSGGVLDASDCCNQSDDPSCRFLHSYDSAHRNHTSRNRIVWFFRREKCKKLSAFAIPQKLVWSVVTGVNSGGRVT
jgi:hypothetical protein